MIGLQRSDVNINTSSNSKENKKTLLGGSSNFLKNSHRVFHSEISQNILFVQLKVVRVRIPMGMKREKKEFGDPFFC
jgi:hypothetical protein